MYQVIMRNESSQIPFIFFESKSFEDCVQVALNFHRACNYRHAVSVFDVGDAINRVSFFSEDYD